MALRCDWPAFVCGGAWGTLIDDRRVSWAVEIPGRVPSLLLLLLCGHRWVPRPAAGSPPLKCSIARAPSTTESCAWGIWAQTPAWNDVVLATSFLIALAGTSRCSNTSCWNAPADCYSPGELAAQPRTANASWCRTTCTEACKRERCLFRGHPGEVVHLDHFGELRLLGVPVLEHSMQIEELRLSGACLLRTRWWVPTGSVARCRHVRCDCARAWSMRGSAA